ncbi:MAG: Flp pilus assembly complex ATPase component TadA, partial [Acidobacteriota bacterium]
MDSTPEPLRLDQLLRIVARQEASDLQLKPRRPPLMRIHGKLIPIPSEPFEPDSLDRLLVGLLSPMHRRALEDKRSVEFGYSLPGFSRFRVTVFSQRGTLAASFHRVPLAPGSLDEIGLPSMLRRLVGLKRGLILMTGPGGSGRSSALAAIVREIVDRRLVQVATIEDPIEFLIRDGLGSVVQLEVGSDVPSATEGVRGAFRQNPDVVVIDEIRSRAVLEEALAGVDAERLVISTLTSSSPAETIQRLVGMFPDEEVGHARHQISRHLEAAVGLRLVARRDGLGSVAAVEIMRSSPEIAKLIREGRDDEIRREMARVVADGHMQTINQSLAALIVHGVIGKQEAVQASADRADLERLLADLAERAARFDARSDEDEAMACEAEFTRIHELLDAEKRFEQKVSDHQRQLEQRDARIEELERELGEMRDSQRGVLRQIRHMEADREEILRAVEEQNREYEREVEHSTSRIHELEEQLREQAERAADQDRRQRELEEARERTVRSLRQLCEEYETKL